jgi:hypothetical protein
VVGRRTPTVGALLSLALLGLGGCGSSGGYANQPRPPAPANVAVAINDSRVLISPASIGAGPVVLLVANESSRSRDLVVDGAGGAACVREPASTGPINPQGTARVSVGLVPGACVVSVRDGGPAPVRLTVGPERTSAQADLLQP